MELWKTEIMKQSEDTTNALKQEHENKLKLLRRENIFLKKNIEHKVVQGCHNLIIELYSELINGLATLQRSTEINLESNIMSVVIKQTEEIHCEQILEPPLSSLQAHDDFLLNVITDMANKNHEQIKQTIVNNAKEHTIPEALNNIKLQNHQD